MDDGRKTGKTMNIPEPVVDRKPRMLLVDDDPVFGKIMMAIAERTGIALTFVQSVRDAYRLECWGFEVAIIDYDLGRVTGVQLTQFLEHQGPPDCIILTSAGPKPEVEEMPARVKAFVQKSEGAPTILRTALHHRAFRGR